MNSYPVIILSAAFACLLFYAGLVFAEDHILDRSLIQKPRLVLFQDGSQYCWVDLHNNITYGPDVGSVESEVYLDRHFAIVKKNNLYGVAKVKVREWLIPPKYSDLFYDRSLGFCAVQLRVDGSGFVVHIYNAKGFSNKEFQFDEKYSGHYEDMVLLQDKDGMYFYQSMNTNVKTNRYIHLSQYSNGFAKGIRVIREKNYGFIIDRHGNEIFASEHVSIGVPCGGLLRYQDNSTKKWGFVDLGGKEIIKAYYSFANNFQEGLAAVRLPGHGDGIRWTYIYMDGSRAIEHTYRYARNFNEGIAAIAMTIGGSIKWGYIDLSGEIIVDPQYEYCGEFQNGYASVIRGDKTILIDRQGVQVFEMGQNLKNGQKKVSGTELSDEVQTDD